MNHEEIILTPILDSIEFIEMSDEEYFSDKYSNYISNSKLSLINPIQGGSPELYKEGLKTHQQFSDSLTFGSAVHELILQPESFFLEESVERPTAKMGAMADELYKYFVKGGVEVDDVLKASDKIGYYKGKMDSIKVHNVFEKCTSYWEQRSNFEKNTLDKEPIYLDAKSRDKLKLCIESVNNNKEIQDLLHPIGLLDDPISMNEAALFINVKANFKGDEIILKLKAKLDNFTIDLENNYLVLNDLKTTGHYLTKFSESFEKYRYFRQMAMYIWLLKLYAAKYHNMNTVNSLTANMLLISTIPDYRAGIFKVSKNQIEKGFREFSDLLKRVAKLELEC